MKSVTQTPTALTFVATIDESLANAIRRYTFEIPVLAIDDVEISRNDSALYDETIAHRLGLVPLVTPKSVAKTKTYALSLNTKKEGTVLSKELTGDVKVAFDEIPLTVLNKGQEIALSATVRLGKGKEHSKFTPGLMVYRNVVEVHSEKNVGKDIVEVCPPEVMGRASEKEGTLDALSCDSQGVMLEDDSSEKGVRVEPTNDLLISVESFGQLAPEDIFKGAIGELKSDLEALSKVLAKA